MGIEITRGISDITESAIDRQYREMEFLYTLMEQEREMEQYVNECLIKASGNQKAIQEMTLLEATSGGDKIKGFFDKIKNFFKKIFDKLGASLNGVFMEQKKYIDKYANIITKCKWQQGDVSDIKDRFKGLPRILDAVEKADNAIIGTNMDTFFQENITSDGLVINTDMYASADKINAAYNDKKNITKLEANASRDAAYTEFISGSGYWNNVKDFASFKQTDSNGTINTSTTFAGWFDGSIDAISYSGDDIENNFQTIINVCYAGASYLTKLEKIVTSVNKKMDEAGKAMETYHKNMQNKIMNAVKNEKPAQTSSQPQSSQQQNAQQNNNNNSNPPGSGVGTGNNSNPPGGNPGSTEAANASAIITGDDYVNEMNINGGSSNSSSTPSTGPTGAGVDDVKNAATANEKINKATVGKVSNADSEVANTTGVTNDNKSDIEKKAKTLIDTDIYNRQIKINESINISSTIVRRMFDSFKTMNSEFFKIIQAHVQWYLGNPGESEKNENKTTRTRNLNMNATGGSVETNQPATGQGQPANP